MNAESPSATSGSQHSAPLPTAGNAMVLDLFAGPGGWDEGAKRLGLHPVGIEWDASACLTGMAAGHTRVRADVSAMPVEPMVGKVRGLIASPPCQDYSKLGPKTGIDGDRGGLVREVMRYAAALVPAWIACEEVPEVLPIWHEYAATLAAWGYATWVGVLNAADYGVPQTRERAFLLASKLVEVGAPPRTHDRHPTLFGGEQPWVSMADALGWDDKAGRWILRTPWNPARTVYRRLTEPSVTLAMGNDGGSGWRWENGTRRERFTIEHAAVVQGFRPDYPWRGSKAEQFRQAGNAVPPPVAASVLATVTGIALPKPCEVAA